MTKKYQIKPPRSMYVQVICFSLLAIFQLRSALLIKENITLLFILTLSILALVAVVLISLVKVVRKNNLMVIEDDKLILNKIEVPIGSIEKIIIHGYFIQSLGIKLYEKKFIMNDLHFRFKNNEEMNIEDFKKWADTKGINVTSGRITRWL